VLHGDLAARAAAGEDRAVRGGEGDLHVQRAVRQALDVGLILISV
jgi:hypothetical protein